MSCECSGEEEGRTAGGLLLVTVRAVLVVDGGCRVLGVVFFILMPGV